MKTKINPNVRNRTSTKVNPKAVVGKSGQVKNDYPRTAVNPNVEQSYEQVERSAGGRIPEETIIAEKFQIKTPISSDGAEAELYSCTSIEDGKDLCIKYYLDNDHFRESVREALMNISHKSIANLISWGYWEGRPYEIWPLYKEQNLTNAIKRKCFGEDQIIDYISQMNEALHVLHSRNIVHQDIKPSNFILKADGTIVLIDFGISAMIEDKGRTHVTKIGNTPDYSAPEIVSGFCWSASDYYSLGVTIYEMLSGRTPYANYDKNMVYQQLADQYNNNIPNIEKFSDKIQDLFKGLLQFDYRKRWQYEAVKAWIFGSYDRYRIIEDNRKFRFSGKDYMLPSQIPDLVISMAFNWSDGIDLMDREGRFVLLCKLFADIEGAEELWSVCNAAKTNRNTDINMFYLNKLYNLYPSLSVFAWRGVTAKDSKELGEKILSVLWQHEIMEETRVPNRGYNPFETKQSLKDAKLTFEKVKEIFEKHLISLYLEKQKDVVLSNQIQICEDNIVGAQNSEYDVEFWYYKIAYLLSGSTELRLGPIKYEDRNAFVEYVNNLYKKCESDGSNESFSTFCKFIYNKKINPGFKAWAETQGFGDTVDIFEKTLKGSTE